MVHEFNRNLYYCKEHRGLKTDGQWLIEVLLDVCGESRLNSNIIKRVLPVTDEYGTRKVASYLHNHRNELKHKLEGTGKDGKPRSPRTKLNYLLSILNGELPKYNFDTQKSSKQSLFFYDPTLTQTPVQSTIPQAESLSDKKTRLLSKMEEAQDEQEEEFVDFCSFITGKQV